MPENSCHKYDMKHRYDMKKLRHCHPIHTAVLLVSKLCFYCSIILMMTTEYAHVTSCMTAFAVHSLRTPAASASDAVLKNKSPTLID